MYGGRVLTLAALSGLVVIAAPGCGGGSDCTPVEGPVSALTLGRGSVTAEAPVDKVLPVVIKDAGLGRPRVVDGGSVLSGPAGPLKAAGGGRQFNFEPEQTGTATIVANARHGPDARVVVHVVCP